MMKFLLYHFCALILIKGSLSQIPKIHPFNCLRATTNLCQNSGTCPAGGGDCDCSATGGYTLFDCSDDGSNPGTNCGCAGADSLCKTNGDCICDQTTYNGDDGKCEYETLQAVCSVDGKIIVNCYFNNVDNLDVFVKDKEATCTFDALPAGATGDMPTDWKGKAKEIPISTNAGDACGATPFTEADGTCVTVDVRHNDEFYTSLDTRAKICCKDGTVTKTVGFVNAQDTGVATVDIAPPAGTANSLDADITDENDVSIAGQDVNIGVLIKLVMQLKADEDFAAIRVEQCQAQIGAADDSIKEEFLVNSCVIPTKTFVKSTTRDGTNKKVTIVKEAIRFNGQNGVHYVCQVLLCRQASSCALDGSCTATGDSGAGRRKRDVTPDNSTTLTTIRTFVNVLDPGSVKETIKDAVEESTTRINMTAAVIGLAVAVLILLAACLILGVCVITRRKTPKELKA